MFCLHSFLRAIEQGLRQSLAAGIGTVHLIGLFAHHSH